MGQPIHEAMHVHTPTLGQAHILHAVTLYLTIECNRTGTFDSRSAIFKVTWANNAREAGNRMSEAFVDPADGAHVSTLSRLFSTSSLLTLDGGSASAKSCRGCSLGLLHYGIQELSHSWMSNTGEILDTCTRSSHCQ